MTLENDKKDKEVQEIKEDSNVVDAKNMGIEMAKAFAEERKKDQKEQKKIEEKVVDDKTIKAHTITVVEDTRRCGAFKNIREAYVFAKAYVPEEGLTKFHNEKALSTYQNIATDADGGSFDPIQAQGILADSVEKFGSFEEDTLQVQVFNSVGTFIDHTGDSTAYMIGENTAGTESKPANTTRTITQKKIVVLSPITGEVLRFGTLADVANATLTSMGRAIAAKKQHLIFIADGDSDTNDGGITGLIPAIEDVAGNSTIYNVGGGGWDNITNTDIGNIVAKPASWGDPSKYAWYCHKNQWGTLEGIARTLNGNNYLLQVGQRPIPSLYGYPVKFVNKMPSSYQDTQIGLLFGDLSSAIATGSNGQTYTDISNSFYFDQDVVALRVIQHIGVNVYQPGTNGAEGAMIAVRYQVS